MKETKFKDTEVGRIPVDWEVISLNEVGEIRMCKRIMKYQTSEKGDIPFYKIGTFGKQADAYIPKELYETYKNKYNYPHKGDVLLSAAGTIGRTVVFDGTPSYYQDSNIVWVGNNGKRLINELLYYIFNTLNWVTESGTIPRIYNGNVRSIHFVIPKDKSEQQRIAAALSNIDALITELDKLIEKKRAIKQGTMQQLLTGKKRLKGFSEPWVEYEIRNICEVKRGVRVVKNQLNTKGEFPVFQNTNIPLGYFGSYNVDEYTPFVIIGGSAGQIGICYTKYWAADDCAYFKCSNMILKEFLYLILLHNQKMILQNVRIGTVPRLDRSVLQKMRIRIPLNIQEQHAITNICSNMEKEVTHLEVKKAKYESIKQGMMQQLLTGKIRLK